jgi:hypothetical protein
MGVSSHTLLGSCVLPLRPRNHFDLLTVRQEKPKRFRWSSWIVVTTARRPSRRKAMAAYSPAVSRRRGSPGFWANSQLSGEKGGASAK